ncbi:hypothetical protein PHISCL_05103 [Aspergillus sclerotialis]|uniref:Uncharacterized protein n=1 Tax=Aspergillus sclerotialis TaxID=2070753 RepID=A0A3A2ZMB5_9EURO|nr:hypothetical protein PHISCL_05103 [Aspergillus sclerotialis]
MAVSTRPSHYQSHDHGASRSHRMAIDSLLNPSVESETTHTQLYSPSSDHPQLSPHFPPSPVNTTTNTTIASTETTTTIITASTEQLTVTINNSSTTNQAPLTALPTIIPHGTATDRRRPPRPKYEEEEMYFIWYHRVDLGQEWKEVRECFNRQFPNRPREGFQGIQCKFYRFIKEKKCPTVREQRRMRDGEFLQGSQRDRSAPRFGVVEQVGVWYPWMREDRDQVLRRKST